MELIQGIPETFWDELKIPKISIEHCPECEEESCDGVEVLVEQTDLDCGICKFDSEKFVEELLEKILPWVPSKKLLELSACKPITGIVRKEEMLLLLLQYFLKRPEKMKKLKESQQSEELGKSLIEFYAKLGSDKLM
jgi:SUMO ligase MMS21 Smc5/6 complex component